MSQGFDLIGLILIFLSLIPKVKENFKSLLEDLICLLKDKEINFFFKALMALKAIIFLSVMILSVIALIITVFNAQ